MKRLWWISLLLQSVLGVVPVIRYKVTDGTKEDSYIGNIGMVTLDLRGQKLPFQLQIYHFRSKKAIFGLE